MPEDAKVARDRLAAEVAAGPPAGASSGRRPLGVPSDYLALPSRTDVQKQDDAYFAGGGQGARRFPPPGPVAPTFFEGAEWTPAGLSPTQRAQLQRDLVGVGLLDDDFQLGVWDNATRRAYADLLSFANASGIQSEAEAITAYREIVAAGGGPARDKARQLPTARLTNPTDVRAVLDRTAREVIGRRVNPADIEKAVAAWHTIENAYATDVNADQSTGGGGAIVEPPNLAAWMEERLRAQAPADAQMTDTINRAEQFFSLLRGSGEGIA